MRRMALIYAMYPGLSIKADKSSCVWILQIDDTNLD